MNIFYLHHHPGICAMFHNDKHCIKMILESTQLLYACLWLSNIGDSWCENAPLTLSGNKGYKLTHKNHPCTIWARESLTNYRWICNLGISLCNEYTYRYNKIHACEKHLVWIFSQIPNIPDIGITPIRLAMPEKYKIKDNPIQSYRDYYNSEKAYFSKWTKRKIPHWFKQISELEK
jgi:hypothetical protein